MLRVIVVVLDFGVCKSGEAIVGVVRGLGMYAIFTLCNKLFIMRLRGCTFEVIHTAAPFTHLDRQAEFLPLGFIFFLKFLELRPTSCPLIPPSRDVAMFILAYSDHTGSRLIPGLVRTMPTSHALRTGSITLSSLSCYARTLTGCLHHAL